MTKIGPENVLNIGSNPILWNEPLYIDGRLVGLIGLLEVIVAKRLRWGIHYSYASEPLIEQLAQGFGDSKGICQIV